MPRRSPFTSVTPRALHRDVGARAHRDADVALRERGRVVDAVAGHRDDVGPSPAAPARRGLVLREHLGDDLVDARAARATACGGRAVVAGEHDDREPSSRSARIASGVVGLIGSATPTSPAARAVDRDEHHRLALARCSALRALGERRRVDASLGEQRARCRCATRAAVDVPRTPLPVTRLEVARRARARAPRASAACDDRRGERMLARALEARGEPQQLVLVEASPTDATATSAACPR